MAYIITETCVDLKDKSCVDVCPVDCIIDGGAEDRMLYINPDECIDCGACVDPCPVAAIYPEDEVPTEQKKFIAWNYDYFKSDADKARVRAEINAAFPEKRQTETGGGSAVPSLNERDAASAVASQGARRAGRPQAIPPPGHFAAGRART